MVKSEFCLYARTPPAVNNTTARTTETPTRDLFDRKGFFSIGGNPSDSLENGLADGVDVSIWGVTSGMATAGVIVGSAELGSTRNSKVSSDIKIG